MEKSFLLTRTWSPDREHPNPKSWKIGPRAEVLATLRDHCPQMNWSSPTEGTIQIGSAIVDLKIGLRDPVSSILVEIRPLPFAIGADLEPALAWMHSLCRRAGWRVLNLDTGMFVDNEVGVPSSPNCPHCPGVFLSGPGLLLVCPCCGCAFVGDRTITEPRLIGCGCLYQAMQARQAIIRAAASAAAVVEQSA